MKKSGCRLFDKFGRIQHSFDPKNDPLWSFLPEMIRKNGQQLCIGEVLMNGEFKKIAWVVLSADGNLLFSDCCMNSKSVLKVKNWLIDWARYVYRMPFDSFASNKEE